MPGHHLLVRLGRRVHHRMRKLLRLRHRPVYHSWLMRVGGRAADGVLGLHYLLVVAVRLRPGHRCGVSSCRENERSGGGDRAGQEDKKRKEELHFFIF